MSSRPSVFYKKLVWVLAKLHERYGCLPDNLSCGNVYSLLLDLPDGFPKSASSWNAILGHPIQRWALVWRKSRLKQIDKCKNDLLWLIIHRAVLVRENLNSWHYIGENRCALCSRVESIEHCFLWCHQASLVWRFFTPFLTRLLGSPFSVSLSLALGE